MLDPHAAPRRAYQVHWAHRSCTTNDSGRVFSTGFEGVVWGSSKLHYSWGYFQLAVSELHQRLHIAWLHSFLYIYGNVLACVKLVIKLCIDIWSCGCCGCY